MITPLNLSLNFSGGGVTFSAEGLPTGLSIDPETGIISGAPVAAGANAVTVTATNESGAVAANFSWRIEAASAPVNAAAPEINGAATIGGTLTAAPGSWTGLPEPAYTYVWTRNAEPISGATGATYVVQEGDVGSVLAVIVTALNMIGSASAASDGVSVVGNTVATEITLSAFATGPGGAAPIFSGRREQNSGLVFVSGSGEPGEVVQGRMVSASDGAGVSPWMDIATANAGDGSFEGWIEGAPRSFDALRAQVRYRDASNAPASTSNTCYIGWVLAHWSQSDDRYFGDGNFQGVSLTATTALASPVPVRIVSVDRDPDVAPAEPGDLYVWDVTGSPPAGRDPVWRYANALRETLTDGPIILMAHQESGTGPSQSVDDNDDARFWEDELLVAQAGQPHLVEIDRPVALDLAYWAWTTSGIHNNETLALGVTGRISFDLAPDGTPVVRDTVQTAGSVSWTQNHSWADLYDWTHSRLAFREHYVYDVNTSQAAFIDHPVYGDFVTGFPSNFSRAGFVHGTRQAGGNWIDTGHPSTNQPGGASEVAASAALGVARATGVYNPGDFALDFVKWPTEPADDPKYVYVGFQDRDLVTMRHLLAQQNPPVTVGGAAIMGGVSSFVVNGAQARSTALVSYGGRLRARVAKPDGSDWTHADTLTWDREFNGYAGLEGPTGLTSDQLLDTLSRWQDFPRVATGLSSYPALQIDSYFAAGLFDNPLPAPGIDFTVLAHETFGAVTASSPQTIHTIPNHDGSPLAIFVMTNSTASNTAGYPTGASLNGVGIGSPVSQSQSAAFKMSVYAVPSPGTGTLALAMTYGASANGGNVCIVRLDGGEFDTPPNGDSGYANNITSTTPGKTATSNGSLALHLVTSGASANEALSGAGSWVGAEVIGGQRTRLAKVEGVAAGATSGFVASFPTTRAGHGTLFVKPAQ